MIDWSRGGFYTRKLNNMISDIICDALYEIEHYQKSHKPISHAGAIEKVALVMDALLRVLDTLPLAHVPPEIAEMFPDHDPALERLEKEIEDINIDGVRKAIDDLTNVIDRMRGNQSPSEPASGVSKER